MDTSELQAQIGELAALPFTPEAQWIARIRTAPVEVLAGAILAWKSGGGVIGGPDPNAPRRSAVQAILQARLTDQVTATMRRLDRTGTWLTIVGLAIATIGAFASALQALHLWGAVGR